jgi:hypothetical protein
VIEATRRKLDEARFFYGHLVEERHRMHPLERPVLAPHKPEAFRFYFSAFIQAARSVTWTLGNEEPEKWKAWEPKWKATRSNEEQKLLNLANELRLDEAKRGGANALMEWDEVALHELLSANFDRDRRHPAYGVQLFNQSAMPGVPSPKATRPAYYFEREDGKEEVTALCDRYLKSWKRCSQISSKHTNRNKWGRSPQPNTPAERSSMLPR